MILGTGLISKAMKNSLIDDTDLCIFACGVSNSNETNYEEFKKELNLIKKIIKVHRKKKFIYFSTSSIETKRNSSYIEHKILVENLIELQCDNYLILRLPNIVGKSNNPFQLVNFFYKSLIEGKEVTIIPNYYRSLLDVEDLPKIIDLLIKTGIDIKKITISFDNKITMRELLSILENITGIKYKKILEKEGPYEDCPDNSIFLNLIKDCNLFFNTQPFDIIQKYYSK